MGRVLTLVLAGLTVLAGCGARSAPHRSVEVTFANRGVTLHGTLSIPIGPWSRWPVAVFISGDGPQDRNGSGELFRDLADTLVAHGVAVLRHDDRGAGRSTKPPGPPSYRALIADTRAAITFARERPEIDPTRVVLIGHSEGAKTSAVLAAEDTSLAGIVMMAGATAVNIDSLLLEQAQRTPDGPARHLLVDLGRARAGERAYGPTDHQDWLREHLEIAPREVMPRIRCPVLILQGDADQLVSPHHAAEAAALIESGGNRRVETRVFLELSHAFYAVSGSGRGPDPVVAGTLARWVARVVSRSGATHR